MGAKFSLAHLTALELAPPDLIYLAAEAGYDCVGLRTISMGLPGEPEYNLAQDKSLLQRTKRALTETGIELLDIELARIYDGFDPKSYEASFDAAAELGGRHVLCSIWTDDRPFALASFATLCELAQPYGLTVELEFVPIASVKRLADAVEVLKRVNADNAGLLIDTHHFYRAQEKVEDLKKLPREWFRYIHLCDAPPESPKNREQLVHIMRAGRLFVGEGVIDIASIINCLPQVPYALEIPHAARADQMGLKTYVEECLRRAQEYMNLN